MVNEGFAESPESHPKSRATSSDSEAPPGVIPFKFLSELVERNRDFNGPSGFRFTVADKPLWIPGKRFSNRVGGSAE